MNKNFKTPIEQILFRSSKIGLLVSGIVTVGLTEVQHKDMERLQSLEVTPIGLTANQQSDLDKWTAKRKAGCTLSPTQMEKIDDYNKRLITPKGLTDNQKETLEKYIYLLNKKPELSDGAKSYVREVWLDNEKGFREEVSVPKMRKGISGEEDAINLISFVDDYMYVNNNNKPNGGRITINNTTGACDVKSEFDEVEIEHNPRKGIKFVGKDEIGKYYFQDLIVIDDTKCSWSPRTFMNNTLTTGYEWQGRSYMYQYDADIFRLRHCLVDCPPDVLEDEYSKFRNMHKLTAKHIFDNDLLEQLQQGQISEEYPKEKKLVDQFFANYMFADSDKYTMKERVKTFIIERDYELEEKMKLAVKLGVEYYQTITLNMIEP